MFRRTRHPRPAAIVFLALVMATAGCLPKIDAPAPLDCANWRYGPADEPGPGVLPAEYDRANYKLTSLRDTRPELAGSPHNLCGQKGNAVDLAWGLNKGRDQVRIAVLDSGIKWRDANAMRDLSRKAYLNLGEADPGCAGAVPKGDCNQDGVFDIADFGALPDLNGNGLADPEDLILSPRYSDGVDDDRNGYVDDISGWDMLYGDNNPLDTPGYGHGTGEATDSTAAENGTGAVGTCPKCRFIPVRVGNSFVADGGRFAAGVLFGLDSGAAVIQEALGTLSNPSQAQAAIDAAYAQGVVVVASMADEASKHPNLPASLEHTMAVNSVTQKKDLVTGANTGWLALNGCTNYGGRTFVSVESGSCSSEATGISAGIVGLLESEARDAGIDSYRGGHRGGNVLSANEAMQVVRASADDIDFATPNAVDPANDFGLPSGGLLDTVRYPTTPGWDATHGYGRINAYEMLRAVRDGRIPPEADITDPKWLAVLPITGTLPVVGRVAAARASSFDYRVEWATGLQPPAYPTADTWHVAASETGRRGPKRGVLARIDLAQVAATLPGGGRGPTEEPGSQRPDEERFAVRVRVVVTAHGGPGDGLRGIMQKQAFVHDDPDLVAGYPRRVPGVSTSSPVFANLDGKPGDELIVGTDDGSVHAYDARGRDIPGFPVHGVTPWWWPSGSAAARSNHVRAPLGSALTIGAPVVADIDGDQSPDLVVTDNDGNVWAWDRRGRRLAGFTPTTVDGRVQSRVHVNPVYGSDDVDLQDSHNRLLPGFAGSPVAADIDGDDRLEIIATSLDRHVYAWHGDGSPVPGFPVLVVDPDKVSGIDPVTHKVTFKPDARAGDSGGLVAPPAVADLTGDGRPEIVVGSQEHYEEPINVADGQDVLALVGALSDLGNTRLFVISPDGTNARHPNPNPVHPDAQAYLPGWPVKIGFVLAANLPTIGDGIAVQSAIGDVNAASPGPEILAQSPAGPVYVLDALGNSVFGSSGGKLTPAAWAGGLAGQNAGRFGANRNSNDIVASLSAYSGTSIGRLSGGLLPDFTTAGSGLTRLADAGAPDLQLPSDDQVTAWNGTTGNMLPGFPQATSDLAFFVTPAVADLDGNGRNEVIAGNGVYMVNAFEADGRRPAGWPKLSGGWIVGTPGLGDLDGDGLAELAVARRDGVLIVWHTKAPVASLTEWARYGGNDRNTGAYQG